MTTNFQTNINTIPSEAYLYFPTGSDMKTPQGDRLIFDGNTQFDTREHTKIAEFKAYAAKKGYQLTALWTDNMILRFLYASGFNMDKTLNSIKQHTTWRQTSLPVHADAQLQRYLNSGILYMHGRDSHFRPIVVFNVNLIDPKNCDYAAITKYLTFYFEFIINECMLPGQVESWVFVVNLRDIKVSTSTAMSLKKVFSYLQENYKCRLHSLYMINAAASVYMPWKIIQKFLDEVTVSKINFYKTATPAALFTHANADQVEQRFGGSATNVAQYWPPQNPSGKFFASKEDENALVSLETYRLLFQQGKLYNMRVNNAFITPVVSYEVAKLGEVVSDQASSADTSDTQSSKGVEKEEEDGEVDVTFLSFSDYSELIDNDEEADYEEYMNEKFVRGSFPNRVTTFRASFILNLSN